MELLSQGHASPTSRGGCSPLTAREPLAPTRSTAGRCPLSSSLRAVCRWPREGVCPRGSLALLSLSSGEVVTPTPPQKPLSQPDPGLYKPLHLVGPTAPQPWALT